MNICDSTRPMRRMLGMPGHIISERACRTLTNAALELPSLHACLCWALILSVSLLMVSCCGRHKEELESANQQIEKLNSEIKKLTEEAARLDKEKSRLGDDLKTVSDKNTKCSENWTT